MIIKFGLLATGLILILIAMIYPSEIDGIQTFTGQIQELNKQRALCDNPQCVSNIDNSIKYANTALSIAKIPDQIKTTFFIFGIIAEAGFVISLRA